MRLLKKLFIPVMVCGLAIMVSTSCSPKSGCPSEVALQKGTKKPKKNVLGKYKKPKSGLLPKGKN